MLKEANATDASNLSDFIIGTLNVSKHANRIKALRSVIAGEELTAQLWTELGFPEYAAMSRNKADAARDEIDALGGTISE